MRFRDLLCKMNYEGLHWFIYTTSNEACDSILDVDDVQTSSNFFDDDHDGQS